MSLNPYESPKEAAHAENRSFAEKAIILVAAALIACFCGLVLYVVLMLVVLFTFIALGILEHYPELLEKCNIAAMLLALIVMGLVGVAAHRRFSRPRSKNLPNSSAPALNPPKN